jgi:hypothetical protein
VLTPGLGRWLSTTGKTMTQTSAISMKAMVATVKDKVTLRH